MNIGIIGSGNIGGTLGRLWVDAGHQVLFSSRHPDELQGLADDLGPSARTGSIEAAAEFGDVVVEAVPFGAVPDLPADKLRGKVVVSTANYYPERDGKIDLDGATQSEWVVSKLPGARLVKAFNMMRAGVMQDIADGRDPGGYAIFVASDHQDAKAVANRLVEDAGFVPVDAGGLADSAPFQTNGPLYTEKLAPADARNRLNELKQGGSTGIP